MNLTGARTRPNASPSRRPRRSAGPALEEGASSTSGQQQIPRVGARHLRPDLSATLLECASIAGRSARGGAGGGKGGRRCPTASARWLRGPARADGVAARVGLAPASWRCGSGGCVLVWGAPPRDDPSFLSEPSPRPGVHRRRRRCFTGNMTVKQPHCSTGNLTVKRRLWDPSRPWGRNGGPTISRRAS